MSTDPLIAQSHRHSSGDLRREPERRYLARAGRRTPMMRASLGDWRDRAACREVDSELFFPVGTGGPALAQAERAIAVCDRCPVIDECLGYAIDTGQDFGIWGGTREDQRSLLRHRLRSARRATSG